MLDWLVTLSVQTSVVKQQVPTPKPQIQTVEIQKKEPKPKKVKKQYYTVKSGDTLSDIAKQHKVPLKKLWAANKKIKHQDRIEIGDKVLIPSKTAKLKPRSFVKPKVVQYTTPTTKPLTTALMGSSEGNTYAAGYCTWYAKSRRPDLPNNLGNANTWYAMASSMGLPVGSVPKVGAVATTTAGGWGHVAIVDAVNSDGTIVVSEMNYEGLGVISSRTTSASEFLYIY